jgi:hypothetical protein
MIILKGFSIPADLILLCRVAFLCIHYGLLLRAKTIEQLLGAMNKIGNGGDEFSEVHVKIILELEKVRKASSFFLTRLIGIKRPCLPRSLVLYHWCLKRGVEAGIAIGVRKAGSQLQGHAWLLLSGSPFMEDPKELSSYKTMFTYSFPGRMSL